MDAPWYDCASGRRLPHSVVERSYNSVAAAKALIDQTPLPKLRLWGSAIQRQRVTLHGRLEEQHGGKLPQQPSELFDALDASPGEQPLPARRAPKPTPKALPAPKARKEAANPRSGSGSFAPLPPVDVVAATAAAEAEAEAEGLVLERSSHARSGFCGVTEIRHGDRPARYRAEQGDRTIGTYGTPEEAALAYARHVRTLPNGGGASSSSAAAEPDPSAVELGDGVLACPYDCGFTTRAAARRWAATSPTAKRRWKNGAAAGLPFLLGGGGEASAAASAEAVAPPPRPPTAEGARCGLTDAQCEEMLEVVKEIVKSAKPANSRCTAGS